MGKGFIYGLLRSDTVFWVKRSVLHSRQTALPETIIMAAIVGFSGDIYFKER